MKVKTATGEVTIKYDDATKVSGASRNTAGLATMSGSQVVVRYKKDGASNMATSIEVKPAGASAKPPAGLDQPRPAAPPPAPGGAVSRQRLVPETVLQAGRAGPSGPASTEIERGVNTALYFFFSSSYAICRLPLGVTKPSAIVTT